MSNIKVNGNTYNDVTSVKLALADGTGYATYNEGAVADSYLDKMLSASYGDIYDERSGKINMSFLAFSNAGTINLPNVTSIIGNANFIVADNILLPKAASYQYDAGAGIAGIFKSAKISGVLDLSGLQAGSGNQSFMNATIGTLKLGKQTEQNGFLQNASITNLIWNNPDIKVGTPGAYGGICGTAGLSGSGAKITNAYVPDDLYDSIKAFLDDGTLTTVTNLYKVSEWSDE